MMAHCWVSMASSRIGGARAKSLISGRFFFQAEDGIRALVRSRGLGDVYKRQTISSLIIRPMVTAVSRESLIFPTSISVLISLTVAVSYTHLTLPTIYSV